jgi:hypothetical protein
MDYEQKHPILQKLDEYLKTTSKEQIDKDWLDILKETDLESYYEKKYKEALERARVYHTGGSISDAHITEVIFPELKESEDDRIKREIIAYINELADLKNEKIPTKWIAWLEKQGKEEYTLKSFKDEDIRKFMQYIEKQAKAYEFNLPNRGYDIYAFTKDILYWLEKQCDNKEGDEEWEVTTGLYKCTKRMFDGSPESRLLFEVGNLYKCISKNDVAEFESSYGHSVFLIDPVVRKHFIKVKDTIEKQDDQSSETYH